MLILAVLQLVCLIAIVYLLIKVGNTLKNSLLELVKVVSKLDKPTRHQIVGQMTTVEAQKEYIRITSIIDEWLHRFSKILANDIMKGLGGK